MKGHVKGLEHSPHNKLECLNCLIHVKYCIVQANLEFN